MKKITSILACFLLAGGSHVYAATVIPSDYIIAGNIGDTWDYENLDSTLFTWTLSEVVSGTNAGRFERGNSTSGMVYDVTSNVLNIYEFNKTPVDPAWGLVFPEIELGQVVTLNDDPNNPSMYLFWKVPTITVQAGTFNDVLAWVWLDDDPAFGGPNSVNTDLGLDSSITTASVTDVNYFVRGIGEIRFQGVDAGTGLSDDTGYELVSTTVVPVPAAVWLFGSGLVGLIGIARRRNGSIR